MNHRRPGRAPIDELREILLDILAKIEAEEAQGAKSKAPAPRTKKPRKKPKKGTGKR